MNLLMHVSIYDINCQYQIKLGSRLEKLKEAITTIGEMSKFRIERFPYTVKGIGKFHLPAHILKCRYKFSMLWMPGVGQTDGEAAERIWADQNEQGARTREMNSGHRHDIINDYYSYMQRGRTNRMGQSGGL